MYFLLKCSMLKRKIKKLFAHRRLIWDNLKKIISKYSGISMSNKSGCRTISDNNYRIFFDFFPFTET